MDATLWGSHTTRQRLMQNIVLIWSLKRFVKEPCENSPVTSTPGVDETRRLTLQREAEIASNLAFLAATTDDPLKVMAVCVEEVDDGRGIVVRMASNTGNLLKIEEGFKVLGRTLERAALRENTRLEDMNAFLRQVVIFDLKRILSRLRSRHVQTSKTKGKSALISLLNTSLRDKSLRTKSGVTQSSLDSLREKAKSLDVLFTELESIENLRDDTQHASDLLVRIVQEAHVISSGNELRAALQTSPVLNPSLVSSLPGLLGKIGRYCSVSSELVCAARDRHCRVFLHFQVESVQLPNPIYDMMLQTPLIQDAVKDIVPLDQLSSSMGDPLGLLHRANGIFQRGMTTSGAYGRIHAEIKLLFFYELYPRHLRPKVISSSKSACFLCDLFIQVHGHFFTPRTHGRIYEKWILPDTLSNVPAKRRQGLGVILTRFNTALEGRILSILMSAPSLYKQPNESILIPSAHWSPTSASLATLTSSESTVTLRPPTSARPGSNANLGKHIALPSATARGGPSLERSLGSHTERPSGTELETHVLSSSSRASLQSLPSAPPTKAAHDTALGTGREPNSGQSPVPMTSSAPRTCSPLTGAGSPQSYQRLAQGQLLRKHHFNASQPILISTKFMEMSISPCRYIWETEDPCHNQKSGNSTSKTKSNLVEVKWLGPDESLPHIGSERTKIIQAEDLLPGSQIEIVPEPGNAATATIYVCCAGDVISVTYEV